MQQNQPGIVKDNSATRMADYVRSLNAERGTPIARASGETPMVSAQVIPASMAAPLSVEEVEARDAAAKAIGVLPRDEETQEIEEISEPGFPRQTAREFMAQNPMGPQAVLQASYNKGSRLIDFKKIQGIDLIRGIVWVDGFEIKIPQTDISKFKRYALDLAVNFVTEQLAAAMAELTPLQEEVNDTDTQTEGETLSEVPDNPATD